MNRKRWAVAGMLASTMAVAGIAAAAETAAMAGSATTLEAAGLPAPIAQALKLERHHHYSHRHHHAASGIKR